MDKAIAQILAFKILGIQSRTGGGVPGNVMAAARRIKKGGGTSADLNVIRDYLGIKKTGSTFARTQLQQIRSIGQKASQFAVLGSVASEGGISGAVAGYQFAQNAAKELGSLAKSGALNKVFEAVVKKPDTMRALGRSVATSVNVAQLKRGGGPVGFNFAVDAAAKANAEAEYLAKVAGTKYSVGRFARGAQAGLGYLAAGAAATYGGLRAADWLSGQTGGESWRLAQSNARIAAVNPFLSYEDRKLGEIALRREDRTRRWGFLAGRMNAGDEEAAAFLRSKKAADSNGGDAVGQYQLARERMYRDRYGFTVGTILNGLAGRVRNATGRNFADNDAIAEQVEKSAARAAELRNDAYELAGRREFDASRAKLDEANKEIGANPRDRVWENPDWLWKSQITDRGAQRVWSALNQTKAKMRTGD